MTSRLMAHAKAAPAAILSLQMHIKETASSSLPSLPMVVTEEEEEEKEE